MIFKRIFALVVIFAITFASAAAQSQTGTDRRGNRELSVEESYLQQSVELMIIREQSRAESRDMKLVALEYINDAIERGNTGREVKDALEYLGVEGTVNLTRENGRIVNNYPDVRTKAATYLGAMGTPEAKDTLIKMCLADNEPMVLTEVVKSLGKIGLNENDETVSAIAWIVRRFDVLNPDNLLAISALDAYEKLAVNGGIKDPNAIRTIMLIAEGNYLRAVQDKAKYVLGELRKHNANAQNSQNQNQSQNQAQDQNQNQQSQNQAQGQNQNS